MLSATLRAAAQANWFERPTTKLSKVSWRSSAAATDSGIEISCCLLVRAGRQSIGRGCGRAEGRCDLARRRCLGKPRLRSASRSFVAASRPARAPRRSLRCRQRRNACASVPRNGCRSSSSETASVRSGARRLRRCRTSSSDPNQLATTSSPSSARNLRRTRSHSSPSAELDRLGATAGSNVCSIMSSLSDAFAPARVGREFSNIAV